MALSRLTGGKLTIIRCNSCQARSAVDKPPQAFATGYICPSCGSRLTAVIKDEAAILAEAMTAGKVRVTNVAVIKPIKEPNSTG